MLQGPESWPAGARRENVEGMSKIARAGWLGLLLVPEAMVGAHSPAWLGKHVLITAYIAAVRFLRTSTSTASRVFWFLLYSVAGLGILV